MALTDYTTYDEVRAVLGVNSDELEDATLALDVYSDHLTLELEGVTLGIPSQFATVADIAETSRTDAQARFFRTCRIFSTYSVARQLASSLPLFGPKEVSDGKTLVTRFTADPYKEVITRIDRKYGELWNLLDTAYSALTSGGTQNVSINFFSVVNSATDPVVE